MIKSLRIFVLVSLPLWALADDAGIALHIDPAADAAVIAVLPEDHPALAAAQPVRDAMLAAEGWRYVEYSGTYTGYALADTVEGDTLLPQTIVYAAPSEEASVLTLFEEGDAVDILVPGSWTTVALSKPLVLYIEGEPAATDEAPAPAEAPVAEEEPQASEVLPAIVDTIDQPSADEPVEEEAPVIQAQPVSEPAPREELSTPATLPQITEGRFVRSPRILFRKPPYDWQLVDEDGKRIAYVDSSQMLLSGSIEALQGRRLIVYGSLDKVTGTDAFVIRAAHVR